MNWNLEEDKKPDFRVPVLAWHECESCKNGVPHMHNCLARPYPIHGIYIAIYHPPDMTLVNLYGKREHPSWDVLDEPHWTPAKPKYWRYVESPYENSETTE